MQPLADAHHMLHVCTVVTAARSARRGWHHEANHPELCMLEAAAYLQLHTYYLFTSYVAEVAIWRQGDQFFEPCTVTVTV